MKIVLAGVLLVLAASLVAGALLTFVVAVLDLLAGDPLGALGWWVAAGIVMCAAWAVGKKGARLHG
ncbi:hypothetical protein AB0C10_21450 [Microbispora amethystogenes]|uniref:hypothetical protein n=1 Tax=Microbispora amethystogenes TaxID=1427754 RepID=UPI0033D8798B